MVAAKVDNPSQAGDKQPQPTPDIAVEEVGGL